MIARQYDNDSIGVLLHSGTTGSGNGRSCIFCHWLKKDLWLFVADLSDLLGYQEPVSFTAGNDRRSYFKSAQTEQSFLDHCFFTDQRQKLLWRF